MNYRINLLIVRYPIAGNKSLTMLPVGYGCGDRGNGKCIAILLHERYRGQGSM